ncbi:hypothetical protein [Nocardioides sp.]|uniref:hypothetical protein n=1 Tax=Nocardioides sp. TaxID=35761 RepID=UPI002628CE29|nr:hypothetical protein [Nocardioides sp.]MDI6909224.1 hypothetical protein [Nocardioides sp.]
MSSNDQVAGWCRVLLEEALYRAATQANAAAADDPTATGASGSGRIEVALPITVSVEEDTLVLELKSEADGPVQLRLTWPFPELNGALAATVPNHAPRD